MPAFLVLSISEFSHLAEVFFKLIWITNCFIYFCAPIADVAKLVDALDLGSSAARHGGSSPSIRTILIKIALPYAGFFLFQHINFYTSAWKSNLKSKRTPQQS